MIRRPRHAAALVAPPVEPPPAPVPPADHVTRGDRRLDDGLVTRLALALHDRRHGDHTPERGKVECARMSGAFDDVYVLEPEILAVAPGLARGGPC